MTLSIPTPNESAAQRARTRQAQLTKPPGALGALETLAVQLAGLLGDDHPGVDPVHIAVFAADHGVTAQGVSAFPSEVTVQMVANFAAGGAAISVLARQLGARLQVVDVGTATDYDVPDGVRVARAGNGTRDFTREPAMTPQAFASADATGREVARAVADDGGRLFVGGEMGIGNTTAASAVACALLGADPEDLVGPGTGIDPTGLARKVETVRAGLHRHAAAIRVPDDALRLLGGFELVALAAAIETAASRRVPVLVDGFIVSVAALAAVRRNPALAPWLIFAHTSAEPGHERVLSALEAHPLMKLGLRLGEGSGAAAAVPLLRLACALHNDMATFEEAAVANRQE